MPARELLIEKQRMLPPGKVTNIEFLNSWFTERPLGYPVKATPDMPWGNGKEG